MAGAGSGVSGPDETGSDATGPDAAAAALTTDAALDRIDALLCADPPDGKGLCRAFDDLLSGRGTNFSAAQLRRLFACCNSGLGFGPDPVSSRLDAASAKALGWRARPLLEGLFHDEFAENRRHALRTVLRSLALGRPEEGGDLVIAPLPHVALEVGEARDLARPYLADLERQLAEDPYAHAAIIWKVRTAPVPPFDRVFDDWLQDIDRRGLGPGDSHAGLDRAIGLAMLAKAGQQRMRWAQCEAELLPQLEASNLMVAGAAARFLGVLLREAELLLQSAPPPLPRILDHIAALPRGRRIVAGGFLQGFDDGDGDPFGVLRQHQELSGYDIDGWVLRVFSLKEAEPYLPSATSFWFHVHEGYAAAPDFVLRLIDAGHVWEAFMCATEAPERVPGMEAVLRSLAALPDAAIAQRARNALDRVFGGDARRDGA